jgi:FKBP-type peptidyl-prolyl cis-trans isomerase
MILSMRSFVRSTAFVSFRRLALVFAIGLVANACTSATSPAYKSSFMTTDVRVGTGIEAASGMTLLVNYSGYLYDETKPDKKGFKFDASPVGQPFVFKLGGGQVIKGWDQGLPGMKVGGLRTLIIPSDLAYGRDGAGSSIPPNATLVFDIELLSIVGG